jgi:hypothetical protein
LIETFVLHQVSIHYIWDFGQKGRRGLQLGKTDPRYIPFFLAIFPSSNSAELILIASPLCYWLQEALKGEFHSHFHK